jgi:hypothetical protein
MVCFAKRMPLVLLAVGLLVVAAGFAYDIAFAGIPFQDPPPELQRRYDRDARVAARIESFGGYITLAGGVALVAAWMVRRPRRAGR